MQKDPNRLIHFSGVHVETGEYLRQPLPLAELRRQIHHPGSESGGRHRALVDWADPDDLNQAGWGIIVHEDENPAILQMLEPLLERRGQQAGDVRKFVFTEEDRRQGLGAIDAFFDRYGTPPGDVDPEAEQLPYYLLVLGSPEKIPFSFQAELDITHASGRLWFEDIEAFGRYANHLCIQETEAIKRPSKVSFYGTFNNDHITDLTHRYLVPPLAKKVQSLLKEPWSLETYLAESATKPVLLDLLTNPQGPALLMTAGHGAVSSKRPLELQGALICSEWQGDKLTQQQYVSGMDLLPHHDFRGLIPFFFACFSAGTPEFDSFCEPGKKPWRWHDFPFISDLAQALLGHERGVPAIIAHVDQAFQYSFLWDESILGIAHFAGLYHHLMAGRRVGYAMEPFRRRFAAALASLKRAKRRRREDGDEAIRCWIGYQDARYYTVLGDPAVRLNLA